jgi:Phage tail tube protein
MTFATGVAKQVVIVEELTEGVSPVSGGKTLRRVSSDLALNKDSYESQEILVSQQLRDARHGVRRPQGTFAGQISPGSFNDFWQGILRNTFIVGSSVGPGSITFVAAAGTFTAAGSTWLTGGIRKHDVVRMSGASAPNTALNGVNLRVTAITATVLTVALSDLPTGLTDGVLATLTVAVPGKKIMIPATGALFKSYSIEHFFSDISVSELFLGCKFGQTAIALPATGLVTFSTQIIGINMVEGVTRQLTTPAAATSSSSLAAVDGKLRYNGVDLAVVTGLNMQLNGALGADPVVGSNIVPHIFTGRFRTTGNMTVLFQDETIFDTFLNEIECELSVMLRMGASSTDFMRFTMPRVKLMQSSKSDSDMSLIQSFGFSALENVLDTTNDLTTVVIQDSLA